MCPTQKNSGPERRWQEAAIAAPEDFKQTMRDYYGIDEGGLAAYFLDPDNVQASLERQSAAARTGAIAAWQNVPNVARDLAEDLYDQGIQDQRSHPGRL